MLDMSATIAAKSDQITADDLLGGPRTITINRVTGNEGNAEQPVNCWFDGDEGRPFRPCKSMRRVMVKVWGADASQYVGRSMTIYRDPKVKWGGMEVGGIRVSHMTGIDQKVVMALTESKVGGKKPYTVLPLKVEQRADDAEVWAEKFIANVGRAPDAERLDSYIAGKQETLAELAIERPDLSAPCQAAIDARRATFSDGGE